MTATLIVMNFQEDALPWIYVIKFSIGMSVFFYLIFTFITTLPYFLLMKKPAHGNNFTETAKHGSMLTIYLLLISLTALYFTNAIIFPELNFCV